MGRSRILLRVVEVTVMVNDIAGARGTISDVVCVGSPVIIKLFTKKVNKQVHEKIWNFQLE